MTKPAPQVYCASSSVRAHMWRTIIPAMDVFNDVRICSTWFRNDSLILDEKDTEACIAGWRKDLDELMNADYLLVFAEPSDRPEGTFVEIGMAVGMGIPIVLVGRYPWSTWRYLPKITAVPTFKEAFEYILAHYNEPVRKPEEDLSDE